MAETRAFRVQAAEICDIDRWVEELGIQWGIPERTVLRARICIAEIAANVLEHGATHPDGDQIVITLRNRAPSLEIEIADSGNAFNPSTPPETASAGPIESTTAGGRGLRLLHSYASAMDYKRDRDQNILFFRVSPP